MMMDKMKNNKDKVIGALKRVGKGVLGGVGDVIAPNIAVKRHLSEIDEMLNNQKYNQILEDRKSRKNFTFSPEQLKALKIIR